MYSLRANKHIFLIKNKKSLIQFYIYQRNHINDSQIKLKTIWNKTTHVACDDIHLYTSYYNIFFYITAKPQVWQLHEEFVLLCDRNQRENRLRFIVYCELCRIHATYITYNLRVIPWLIIQLLFNYCLSSQCKKLIDIGAATGAAFDKNYPNCTIFDGRREFKTPWQLRADAKHSVRARGAMSRWKGSPRVLNQSQSDAP